MGEKLEQFEMIMGSVQQDQLSNIVHYNPSDLSGWVQTMLTEPQSRVIYDDNSEYDLKSISGIAALPPQAQLQTKRLKPSVGSSLIEPRPLVVVDSQDTWVRLVHTLMACAEAVQQDNLAWS